MYYLLIRYANRQIGTLPPVHVRVLCICPYALDAARLLKMRKPVNRLNLFNAYLHRKARESALSPACAACARIFNEHVRTRHASRV